MTAKKHNYSCSIEKRRNYCPNTQKLYKFCKSMKPYFIESPRKFSLLVSFLLTLRFCLWMHLNWTIDVILYKSNAYFSSFFSFNSTCTLSLSFTSLFRTALGDFFSLFFISRIFNRHCCLTSNNLNELDKHSVETGQVSKQWTISWDWWDDVNVGLARFLSSLEKRQAAWQI